MWSGGKVVYLQRFYSQLKMKRYPIGIQTFSKIIEGKWQYIDKTGYVYDIAKKYQCVFLSRPRRFGKSLLATTFHSYFAGEKELFEGLEAGRLEKDWTKYPVLHFDMSMAKHQTLEGLHNMLGYMLSEHERKYDIIKPSGDENLRLTNLIKRCKEKYGQNVVIIIDEYDAPLLDVLDDRDALEANRQVMRNFYSPLKACDADLRFVFITGITKFSQLSIFSELNNLKNISMYPEYAGICGITEEEMTTQFSGNIDDMATRLNISREETIVKLKERYDGYHFSHRSPDVYNPFSLINALDAGEFDNYWFDSGTPTYLIHKMRQFGVNPQEISEMSAYKDDFDASTENMTSIIPLLYQSGYVTIKEYDSDSQLYTLGIPNREVRRGLMKNMLGYVAGDRVVTPASRTIAMMYTAFNRDDIDTVMEQIKMFLSSIPKTDNIAKDYEGHYQSLLFVIFSMLCQYVDIEVHTPKGRADIVMNAKNAVYVIELKLDKTAEFAINQIDLRQYGERFLITGKPIIKVGVNFDTEVGNIKDWQVVE